MDEFDCYNEAFIAANGIPISHTRRWFFEQNDTSAGLLEIWDFFINWMQTNSKTIFGAFDPKNICLAIFFSDFDETQLLLQPVDKKQK